MITFMRRYRRSLQVGLLLVIGAFIASLFVFGQRGFGDGAGRDAVATVNGEAIPLSRYQRAYQAYVNMYSQMSRAPVTPELAERSEEHTSELQSRLHLVCRLLLEKKKK